MSRIEVVFYSWFSVQGLVVIAEALRYIAKELIIGLLIVLGLTSISILYERRKLLKLVDKLFLEGGPMDDGLGWLLAILTLTMGGIIIAILLL